jgi:quinoprotein glucose dehydrogenase
MKPLVAVCALLTFTLTLSAQETKIPDGTAEGTKAIAKFKVPDGFKAELWAAEPLLGQPVAFCIDEKGRIFVAETYRFNRGTEEYRTRPFFLEGDLSNTTVDDRLAMYKKHADKFAGGMGWFTKHADKIRLLEDRKGLGRADTSSVFADGFNDPLDGLAAGVLAKDGDVYFTCIPKLWKLRDTKGVGRADVKEALHHGFGPQTAFLGHDLHGLVFGPDGKLYFSVGDRGYHVKNKEGVTLSGPRQGAVFRCDPDGANLEVVHVGLRNPQELAFDQFGNLFAADNNCDKGDHSRLVWIVEGGHSGWNMAYQTMEPPYMGGPWFAEKLWHLHHAEQPAWIVPPVGKLGAGPSGFAFTSGLGWPARYQNAFFMCNFTGNGGVDSFRVKSKGASFEIDDYHPFLTPVSATDVDFGYDGKMYLSDWVQFVWEGGGVGKGRIYTAFDPKTIRDPAILNMAKIMSEGFKQRPASELADLLAHPDQRVRLRAQYALAEKKELATLRGVLSGSKNQLARLHALWGMGQIARNKADVLDEIAESCKDDDFEIRANAVKLLGDLNWKSDAAASVVTLMVLSKNPRVSYYAMQTAGKLKINSLGMVGYTMGNIARNQDRDPYLRHAAVEALARILDTEQLDAILPKNLNKISDAQKLGSLEQVALHRAMVLVLRKRGRAEIASYLTDADESVATEAARAINDLPLADGMPALAALAQPLAARTIQPSEALWRRVINANFRLGQAKHAKALVDVLANKQIPETMRLEALACLVEWHAPGPRDRVIGHWRPLPARNADFVPRLFEEHLAAILGNSTGKLQTELARAVGSLKLKTDDATFVGWVRDPQKSAELRIEALNLLSLRKNKELATLVDESLQGDQPRLRAAARAMLVSIEPKKALASLQSALKDGTTLEKQQALRTLAKLDQPAAHETLAEHLDRLKSGTLDAALQLDALQAAESRKEERFKKQVAAYEQSLKKDDPLAKHRVSLQGGDAERGRQLFVSHPTAQCIRCHKVGGQGGDAGPNLSEWAPKAKGDRVHFLESLIQPSKKITPGYAAAVVVLNNGQILTGTIRSEDDEKLTLALQPSVPDRVIWKKDIDSRISSPSPMPEMAPLLRPEEIRDLVEYLATLK